MVVGEDALSGGDKVSALLCGQTDDVCLSLDLKAGLVRLHLDVVPFE